jgi:hypothetical protein
MSSLPFRLSDTMIFDLKSMLDLLPDWTSRSFGLHPIEKKLNNLIPVSALLAHDQQFD